MLLKIYQYLISRKILVYFVLLYSRDLSRLNVKEERANSFVVAESVTCTQAIDFSTLVAGNKKKKKKHGSTRIFMKMHHIQARTLMKIQRQLVKRPPQKKKEMKNRFEVDRDRKRSCWSRT